MGTLWALTTYFNPVGYARRLSNYRIFRRLLEAPLLTIEWSHSGAFELESGDADVLVQVSGGDVMWQKERLLNVGLGYLPADCEIVAWLDCDIVFASADWIPRARRQLDEHALVQLFTTANYMPEHVHPDVTRRQLAGVAPILTGRSIAFQLAERSPEVEAIARRFSGQNDGLAWAASKELMLEHGFYDARIVGGGGMGILKAASGAFMEYVDERSLNSPQAQHYLAWALPYFEAVGARIGFLDGCVSHLWHGDLGHRQYRVRQRKLNEHDFDPYHDIALGESGCWHWSSAKPALHRYLEDYFVARQEDGVGERSRDRVEGRVESDDAQR